VYSIRALRARPGVARRVGSGESNDADVRTSFELLSRIESNRGDLPTSFELLSRIESNRGDLPTSFELLSCRAS